MSAYVIVGFTPTNLEKLKQYGERVASTLKPFSGTVLARGPITQLHGEFNHEMQVIIQFNSKAEAQSWYQSDEYQSIISLRDSGMDSQFQLID